MAETGATTQKPEENIGVIQSFGAWVNTKFAELFQGPPKAVPKKEETPKEIVESVPRVIVPDFRQSYAANRREAELNRAAEMSGTATNTTSEAGAAPPVTSAPAPAAVDVSKMSEKARKAYTETQEAIVEKVAIGLKKNGNIVKLAQLAGEPMELPQDDAEYRRIAKELIETRKFTFKDKDGKFAVDDDGKKIEITIEKIDERRVAFKDMPEDKRKEMLGDLASSPLDKLIPDSKRSANIAKAVSEGVEENTGMFSFLGGATIMNAIIGLFQWIMSGFEGGFDGLKSSIANVTANSIAKSTETRLRELGESPENIKEVSESVRTKALKEAGYPDKKAKTERLEDIKVEIPKSTTPPAPSPAPTTEPARGAETSTPASKVETPVSPAAGDNGSQNKKPDTISPPPAPAPSHGATPDQRKSGVLPAVAAATATTVIAAGGAQKKTTSPEPSTTTTAEPPTVIVADIKIPTKEYNGLSGKALEVVQQIKSDTEKAFSQPQPTLPVNTAKTNGSTITPGQGDGRAAYKDEKPGIKTAEQHHTQPAKAEKKKEEKKPTKDATPPPQKPVVAVDEQKQPKPQMSLSSPSADVAPPIVNNRLEKEIGNIANRMIPKDVENREEVVKHFTKFLASTAEQNSTLIGKPQELTKVVLDRLFDSPDPLAKKSADAIRTYTSKEVLGKKIKTPDNVIRFGLEAEMKGAIRDNKEALVKAHKEDEAAKTATSEGKKLGSLGVGNQDASYLAAAAKKVGSQQIGFS